MQNDPKNDLISATKTLEKIEIGKSKKLDQLKPYISACQKTGYTHAKIVSFLEEGGLIIDKQVFSNYLSRRAKGGSKKQLAAAKKSDNTIEKPKDISGGFGIVKNELDNYS